MKQLTLLAIALLIISSESIAQYNSKIGFEFRFGAGSNINFGNVKSVPISEYEIISFKPGNTRNYNLGFLFRTAKNTYFKIAVGERNLRWHYSQDYNQNGISDDLTHLSEFNYFHLTPSVIRIFKNKNLSIPIEVGLNINDTELASENTSGIIYPRRFTFDLRLGAGVSVQANNNLSFSLNGVLTQGLFNYSNNNLLEGKIIPLQWGLEFGTAFKLFD